MIRIHLKGGDEYDCLTRWGKKYLRLPSKTKQYAKRKYNKRFRKEMKKRVD